MDNNPPLSLCKREILTGAPDSKSAKPYCRPFLSTPALSPGQPLNKGLKVLRPGLHLGTAKKGRFEPSHALALTLHAADVLHTMDLPSDGREIRGYLNGETFPAQGEKGWYLITVDGYSTGWGKLAGGIMKNHYPKGLRKRLP